MITRASLRAMRDRARDYVTVGAMRRPSNSKDAEIRRLSADVLRLCDEVERLKA
jgi:hypothetical protein